MLESFSGVPLSHKLLRSKKANKKCVNLFHVSHCHTNWYELSHAATTTSIILRCHTVTQIAMQWDGQQKLHQSVSGVKLSHRSPHCQMASNNMVNLSQMSHCHTIRSVVVRAATNSSIWILLSHCHKNRYALRLPAKTVSIFLGFTLSHKLLFSENFINLFEVSLCHTNC
jgi:hypothetical protein